MPSLRVPLSVGTAALLAFGCASPSLIRTVPVQQLFLHVTHRETYRMTDLEIEDSRFYVSKNVMVQQPADAETLVDGATGPLRVRRVDPGTVTEVGPTWLRVSFGTGTGVLFVTEGTNEHQHYRLATVLPDREGMFLVKDLPEPAIYHEGHMYPVIYGADTELLVNVDDLRVILESRNIVKD